MNSPAFFRTFLLVIAVGAALSATFFDAVVVRYFMRPFMRRLDEMSYAAGSHPAPAAFRFMFDHAWARRGYNVLVSALALLAWWYLGTPAGARLLLPH